LLVNDIRNQAKFTNTELKELLPHGSEILTSLEDNIVLIRSDVDRVHVELTPDDRYLVYYPENHTATSEVLCSEMSAEDVQEVLDANRTASDLGYKAQNGSWPK
jgi:hypothetical protein